ncbi:hypothetical protein ATEIFO6365_0008022800 [Aspergillus terreus]|uniref:Uncharacterized protein n=1 Tax=Aspergillus terreus TaxID=33178 RepID=A0A5M3Z7J1_ASPTE|nr:hypothetical protein ATETN484_0010023700 [Aspergillus terreus]GFF18284.1 hypothetical protein ATEIFO6365_0008022800 [Aspergillus terreus]
MPRKSDADDRMNRFDAETQATIASVRSRTPPRILAVSDAVAAGKQVTPNLLCSGLADSSCVPQCFTGSQAAIPARSETELPDSSEEGVPERCYCSPTGCEYRFEDKYSCCCCGGSAEHKEYEFEDCDDVKL